MKDKRVLVVGMGRSGRAAVEALLSAGAKVAVQDSKPIEKLDPELAAYLQNNDFELHLGSKPENSGDFDMFVLSPGVPPTLDFIQQAADSGTEIIGELELAYRFCKGKFVAITGTNGKTTTTTLVGEIYKAAGKDTCVGGNIGRAIASLAREASPDTWMITETSSFQLETIRRFCPEVSAILNLTPDHMDRHKTMENYGKAKARVFENQSKDQYCVLNYDDKACFELAKRENCNATVVPFSRLEELEFGAFARDEKIIIRDEDGKEIEICGVDELKIPGSHNLENALAAAAITYFGGIAPEVIGRAMREFPGVAHRIELCREVNGVRFVNDSKGTNTDAAIKAVEAMKVNIILIAGGYDKESEYDDLMEVCRGRVKKMLLIGVTAPKIKKAAEAAGIEDIVMAKDMDECVRLAYLDAVPGDVVLLSPACASWDMYDNFEQRGDHFRECAMRL